MTSRNEWKILSTSVLWGALKQDTRSQVLLFFRRSSLCNFTLMETIPNHTDSCPMSVGGHPRVTTPTEDLYIAIVAKRNHRATSKSVTSMVTEPIGKAISTVTVRRRLHMNGLYTRVPRVCVPLSVQSKGA
ncbi:transposable element Tc1 transposase [Trichonephila clavipes]|uniref:Transposable element Tc1 transposase n=1 Tax=Trichonephila clavipes TaxID=2585209 RepID=A0A8X6V3V5_TRICX|nr:transposable element Tc1 transposase [Trichonephila clavipes]